ncbi:uncharacterized protein L201_005023 [Kwoniella dendrophila CBS 6074]|uniref:Bestrophin, RFP-TM, chloride channel-domain-containing protein n=1 Tax=Kwoniella dendrophila CBS 6074 TaxID=1295534 RepID=A0AAX4JZX0_9TREE
MARRRLPTRHYPKSKSPPSQLKTRLDLLTYAFSRLPPRQLPFLAAYAYAIIYAADRGWVNKASLGKGGANLVGVLSMVTGLLVSYRFSSAITKWDEGRQVWAAVRITIRDGMRMLSIPNHIPSAAGDSSPNSSPIDIGISEADGDIDIAAATEESKTEDRISKSDKGKQKENKDPIAERVDELAGLLVGFAFALQHHLHGTRPLPQPPLCDLLPSAYLASLKRTDARVRFAESHAGPSGSGSNSHPATGTSTPSDGNSARPNPIDDFLRPGLRRRGTGPPTKEEKALANGEEEWELSNLRDRAEEAVTKLAEAVALSGLSDEGSDLELRQQLNQLNLPNNKNNENLEYNSNLSDVVKENMVYKTNTTSTTKPKSKSNIHIPNPPNLPLSLLKLIESYIIGLSQVDADKGGWNEAKRERGLGLVKTLSGNLGEAERLSSNPPPLPLTLHLSHLLIVYLAALPCSLLCVVNGWSVILITLIAGWCLLGLEALIGEVGGVFGSSENHLPLPMFTQQILNESLDISPSFLAYYRARLVSRLGENSDSQEEIEELDRKKRRTEGEWIPSFD